MSNVKPTSKNNSPKPTVIPVAVTESVETAAKNLKEAGAKEKKQQGQNGGARHSAAHRQAVRRMKKAMTKMNMALKKCNKKRMTRRRKH